MQSGPLKNHLFMKQCLHRIVYISQRFYAGANYSKMDNLYTRLELTASATQADIKNAYYELSKKYHPDRNDGSTTKFRSISEAYEILGNVSTRKDYDQRQCLNYLIDSNNNKCCEFILRLFILSFSYRNTIRSNDTSKASENDKYIPIQC